MEDFPPFQIFISPLIQRNPPTSIDHEYIALLLFLFFSFFWRMAKWHYVLWKPLSTWPHTFSDRNPAMCFHQTWRLLGKEGCDCSSRFLGSTLKGTYPIPNIRSPIDFGQRDPVPLILGGFQIKVCPQTPLNWKHTEMITAIESCGNKTIPLTVVEKISNLWVH